MSEPVNRQVNKRVTSRTTGDHTDPVAAAKMVRKSGSHLVANVAAPRETTGDHLTPPLGGVVRGPKSPYSAKVPVPKRSGSKDKAQTGR